MKNQYRPIEQFFRAIENDGRISNTHISLYFSLLYSWVKNKHQNPVVIVRNEIMQQAKISSRYTYVKHIKQLSEYGYLTYSPSSDHLIKSKVYLLLI